MQISGVWLSICSPHTHTHTFWNSIQNFLFLICYGNNEWYIGIVYMHQSKPTDSFFLQPCINWNWYRMPAYIPFKYIEFYQTMNEIVQRLSWFMWKFWVNVVVAIILKFTLKRFGLHFSTRKSVRLKRKLSTNFEIINFNPKTELCSGNCFSFIFIRWIKHSNNEANVIWMKLICTKHVHRSLFIVHRSLFRIKNDKVLQFSSLLENVWVRCLVICKVEHIFGFSSWMNYIG